MPGPGLSRGAERVEVIYSIVASLIIALLAGCAPSEDVGTRLRRECASIVREGLGRMQRLSDQDTETLIARCVDTRGQRLP